MLLDTLIRDNPQFHGPADAAPTSWAVGAEVLRFIHDHVKPGMHTLETGSGHTTVAFAITGSDHTCITPNAAEADRIAAYCKSLGLDDRIRFILQRSDTALPRGEFPDKLDFVFLDGAHRFPLPIIDCHYTEPRLNVGGILGIDDFNMPSVRVLYDFLRGEKEWELIREVANTAFFRKLAAVTPVNDWQGQRMNAPENWNRGAQPTLSAGLIHHLRRVLGGRR